MNHSTAIEATLSRIQPSPYAVPSPAPFGRVPRWMLEEGLSGNAIKFTIAAFRWYDNVSKRWSLPRAAMAERCGWSIPTQDRVLAELRAHDALESETAYSAGVPRTWYRLTRLDAVPFSRVPLWMVGEVSARAVRTYAALDTFMDYREPALSKVIPSAQVAERLGCSTRTFWRGVAELRAVGAIHVSPQYGPSHYQTPSGFTLQREQPINRVTANLSSVSQLPSPPLSPPDSLSQTPSEFLKKHMLGRGWEHRTALPAVPRDRIIRHLTKILDTPGGRSDLARKLPVYCRLFRVSGAELAVLIQEAAA